MLWFIWSNKLKEQKKEISDTYVANKYEKEKQKRRMLMFGIQLKKISKGTGDNFIPLSLFIFVSNST